MTTRRAGCDDCAGDHSSWIDLTTVRRCRCDCSSVHCRPDLADTDLCLTSGRDRRDPSSGVDRRMERSPGMIQTT